MTLPCVPTKAPPNPNGPSRCQSVLICSLWGEEDVKVAAACVYSWEITTDAVVDHQLPELRSLGFQVPQAKTVNFPASSRFAGYSRSNHSRTTTS